MKTDTLTLRALDKKLATAIDAMDCGRGKEFHDVFDEFLDLSLGLMANNPNPHQVELLTRMRDNVEYKDTFVEAINAYGEAAVGYHDPLGDVFMERISHGHNGQFFTPEEMCRMTAQITEATNGYINDPTCGSGRMLLAGLKLAREKGMEPWLCGQDLSYTCAKMTLLNLMVNRARGYVTCGNTLLYDCKNWTYYRIERVFTLDGNILSTYWQYFMTDVDAVDAKRTTWLVDVMQKGLWVERSKAPSEVKEQQETINQ